MQLADKLLICFILFLAVTLIPLSFASPHAFHETPQGPYYKTMSFYTHIKEVPIICVMQSENRDLMLEYTTILASEILNANLPQSLHTYTKVIPFLEHDLMTPEQYPECFVFVLQSDDTDNNNFATTQFYNDYRLIKMNNLTLDFNDMLYISTHEIIHAVYGLEHLYCGPYLKCDGIMEPVFNSGDPYNLTQSDIDAIIEINSIVHDNNVEFTPHWIPYRYS
uniref:Metallopeptidase n=1 Tax=Nitrosopumivirus cobalaminus TaxID=3158414 RepID=A0AAU7N5X9_9VIRU